MDTLKAASLCALLATSPHAPQLCSPVVQVTSPAIDRWQPLIDAASARFDVPTDWIRAVMARESAGFATLHGTPIISSAGAMGLMQLMPATWSEMRNRYSLGPNPFDPHDNIFAGTAYLREMFDHFGYPDLFAAYQAGPGRLQSVLDGQSQLPPSTESYLESIAPGGKIAASTIEKPTENGLFFVRADTANGSTEGTGRTRETQSLFVPLALQPRSPPR